MIQLRDDTELVIYVLRYAFSAPGYTPRVVREVKELIPSLSDRDLRVMRNELSDRLIHREPYWMLKDCTSLYESIIREQERRKLDA